VNDASSENPPVSPARPEPVRISDPDDARLDPFRDVRDRDLRSRDGLFMAESERVLSRLVRTPERLHSILLSPGRWEALQGMLAGLPQSVPVHVASLDVMCAIAGFHVHRGVLATGIRPTMEELAPEVALAPLMRPGPLTILVCEGITNVDNIGGLFRNAAAFGVDGVLLDPACCDPLYRKAVRVSAGHVLSTPWAVAVDWPADLRRLREAWDVDLVAAETGAGATAWWSRDAPERQAILLGSEARGVSAAALAECDAICEVPMAAGVPSMNVATTSAVFLAERARRRAAGGGAAAGGAGSA
jgi:tRNA G18 (ribose-2'-O)-methylase SpoU